MFRDRRQLRRWAARVLLLWLFGIGAGFANACVAANMAALNGPGSIHAVAAHATYGQAAAMPGEAHHGSPVMQPQGGTGHEGSPGKTNCQDFCDKSSISIPTLKLALDHADGGVLHSPAVAIVFPVPASGPVETLVPRRDGVLAPPITIAFLRLAL
jgi:hypothetical protein